MQQQPAHPMGPMGSVPPANITTEQIQKFLDENKQLILAILDNQNLGRLAECAQWCINFCTDSAYFMLSTRSYGPIWIYESQLFASFIPQKTIFICAIFMMMTGKNLRYQAHLQKNLLYLAAIADAQPQAPAMRPQMIPHAVMPQASGQYMQQAPIFPPKTPLQFTPQQAQELQQQQQQQLHHPQMMPFQGHMGMRPIGVMNGMHAALHTESSHGGGSGNEAPSGGAGMSEPLRGSTPSSTTVVRGSKPDAGSAASEHAALAADSKKNPASEQGSGDAEAGANPKRLEGSKTP